MSSPLFDLSGKTALITGSTKGIGKAIATHYAMAGANVVISSRSSDLCDEVAAEIDQLGSGKVVAIPANVSRDDELDVYLTRGTGKLSVACFFSILKLSWLIHF